MKTSEAKEAEIAELTNTFELVARNWFNSTAHKVREVTLHKKIRRFETHIFPKLGGMAINKIKSSDILSTLKPIIDKNHLETAHRINSEIDSIFKYAIVHNITDQNPAQPVYPQIPAQAVKHRAALTEPKDVAKLLRDIHSYQGTFVVQIALKITPLLFQRPGEIRQMRWEELDFDSKEWRYLVTKKDIQHIVPLSSQVISLLEEIRPLTGQNSFVFPSSRGDGRPMSNGTIITALKTLGYGSDVMTAHGFRTTASTLLNEQGWSPDAIERQLSHMPRDKIRAAYNRAEYLAERRRLMQSWADYLEGLKRGANIIPINRVDKN